MGKYLWLAVEADEYELPLAVADSARELAIYCNSTKHNIETLSYRDYNGRISGRKIIRVLKDE